MRRDPAALRRLLAPDFCEIGQCGRVHDRDAVVAMLAADDDDDAAQVDEESIRYLDAGVVLLTYRLRYGSRTSRRSSLWRLGAGGPVLVFQQGTAVPDDSGSA